jgi:lactoylglutathione lyase
VRTLQFGLKVADRETSAAFYAALGFEVVGEVPDSPIGHLTMLKLPDDEFVSLELVHDPSGGESAEDTTARGFSHFAIQVESLEATVQHLAASGIRADAVESPAPGLHTTNVTDPDGRTIELVQWPPGHAVGMSAADWPDDDG